MTARDDYRAAEERLAEVERRLEDDAVATVEEQGSHGPRRTAIQARMLTLPDRAALLIERERLQEESYRAYRRVVTETSP